MLPNHVASVRRAQGLTVRRLAERAGVEPSTVVRVEQWLVDPRMTTASALAAALGVSLDLLFPSAALAIAARAGSGASTGEVRNRECTPAHSLDADALDALADAADFAVVSIDAAPIEYQPTEEDACP
jgi:transcriptional regulator with XRE-family HTH domain